jgi:xylan 1,4-beta-xylosidase
MSEARTDWENRIAVRSDVSYDIALPDLDPPSDVTAVGGVGQVTIDWSPVDGAVGYLVHRGLAPDGPFAPVDHHGQDVLAVPHAPYVDTTVEPGVRYFYALASVPEVTVTGRLGSVVSATALPAGSGSPSVTVWVDVDDDGEELHRPWVPMIGSERLSQLLCTDLSGGRVIGVELAEALRRVRDELGVRTVRAHAIFHDDTRVYREKKGKPVYDFSVVDEIYDQVLDLGLRPVVEIGFMPRDLAADPSKTVFEYGAVISPPKDYERWGELVRRLVQHLVGRYGLDEVLTWDFEVWNEANLSVFWSGTRSEWLRLYDVTVAAVRSVDSRFAVGGPSSAAAGWVDDLLAHAAAAGSPVDFVSTHTYGSPPLDVRASLERHGFGEARILWTEWGVTPRHFNPISDAVFSGVFVIRGMRSAAGRVDALSYWVASDHFEELGRPPRLLHGGFGLLSVGGLAKPRYHALTLLNGLGPVELPTRLDGDGAGSLVEAWASRDRDRIAVLVWNLTLDQSKSSGSSMLARRVRLELPGLEATWQASATMLAPGAGDLVAAAEDLGIGDWPASQEDWAALAEHSALRTVPVSRDGSAVELLLPMPSAVLVEFRPVL